MRVSPIVKVAHAPQTPADLQDALKLKADIAERALELGFDLVGFASPEPFVEAQRAIEERVDAGLFSGLPWFTRERAAVSGDPHNLMPEVRTIVSLGISYLRSDGEQMPPVAGRPRGKVARYAWGEDYHDLFRDRLMALHASVEEMVGRPIEARTLSDTARIVDRAVAQRAGLGWYGKNTNILSRTHGSWILLGELLLDFDLPPDVPVRTNCGSCIRCMPACPTGALVEPGVLHNDRCISYLTIEHRDPIPREMRPLVGTWVFGCDICQEVCPVNRKAVPGYHEELGPERGIGGTPDLIELIDMSEAEFRVRFKRSPVKRAKWAGLRRNAAIALGNAGDTAAVPALVRALACETPLVRGHAAWALGRLGSKVAHDALVKRLSEEIDEWVREEIDLALAEHESLRERGREIG
ncbi:MAG TPA: tRNA epoxyqueuosine(34) reductase QueG [Chloroflexia bacterium]|nr:tRNA epoxyqueuosine(34) reductase QueG [Chloroflexia bacterium]